VQSVQVLLRFSSFSSGARRGGWDGRVWMQVHVPQKHTFVSIIGHSSLHALSYSRAASRQRIQREST
jgi:hypothetical protein